RNRLIDHAAITRETALPVPVTQHDNTLLTAREHASGRRLRLQHRKEIRRHVSPANALRLRSSRHVETVIRISRDRVEDFCLFRVIFVLSGLGAQAFDIERAVITPNYLQPLGMWKRKRPQQHGVHDTKDRSARPDSQRKRHHHDRRKPRLLNQTSESVTQIVHFSSTDYTDF